MAQHLPHYHSAKWMTLLLLSVIATAGLQAQVVPSGRAEQVRTARAYVKAGRLEEAKQIFRNLAERNPGDIEARVWVARLESWQGDYPRAEELYQNILRDDPDNVEALLGLVDVLGWQSRFAEGMTLLADLHTRLPNDVEVLLRFGRFHRWQRHRDEALSYYRQVLSLSSDNAEASQAVWSLRRQTAFRLETGYFMEEFDFAGNTNGQSIQLLYRDYDRVTFLLRSQYQNKFGQDNTSLTVGGTYRFGDQTWIRGEFSAAPSNDTVIANADYTLELTQGLTGGVALGGGYRYLDFDAARVTVLTALGDWDVSDNLHLYVRYKPSRTEFRQTPVTAWNHNGWLRLVWDADRHFSPFVFYGVGAESFESFSADQLGRFAAQIYGGGTEIRFGASQGIRAGYYYQNRTQGHREQTVYISYYFGF